MKLDAYWEQGVSFDAFLRGVEQNRGLWEGVYRLARLPEGMMETACAKGKEVRLLVIAEDWCGDAANSIPPLARFAEETDCLNMRIIERDPHPELMDRYLTNGARAIPIIIAMDEDGNEIGHWGPRPAELQEWVMAHKDEMPKSELYPQTRKWYARDRARTSLTELLAVIEADD